ncbi:hypothetical protein J2Y41_004304 [Arthrobacter sp. 1088]|nr:hypothetical protein [Arthrobacter sp. 1088]
MRSGRPGYGGLRPASLGCKIGYMDSAVYSFIVSLWNVFCSSGS